MKSSTIRALLLAASASAALASPAKAEDALVYRGQLQDNGAPASGQYDLEFRVHGDRSSSGQLVGPLTVKGVQVNDGSFAVALPVGMPLLPESGWVTVAVRHAGSSAPFEPLPGQQMFSKAVTGSCPGTWSTTGNAGIGANEFLGTTDAQTLELRSNNIVGLRLVPASIPNIVAGSSQNFANVVGGVISGGGGGGPAPNRVNDNFGAIGGGSGNTAGFDDASSNNQNFATVGGGLNNNASGPGATIGGGSANLASESTATVAGGFNNRSTQTSTAVGGGENNSATANHATVAGGIGNVASGTGTFIGGGAQNTAAGVDSVVPGGLLNLAGGAGSFAAGRRAQVQLGHEGSFAWNSVSTQAWQTTGSFQFIVRAPNGVGLGTNAPRTQLHVENSISSSVGIDGHMAFINNTSTGTSPDVLALKVGTPTEPGGGANFVSFFDGSDNSLGAIQGNGSGGVVLAGPGNDYAEYLRKLDSDEFIAAGDVVGVFAGKVSRRTAGAEMILVASSGAIIAGNDPGEGKRGDFVLTAMMGQAELEVSGAVAAGDYLLPSGLDDARAIAVAPSQILPAQLAQVIGRAWEVSATDNGVSRVKAVVGLSRSDAAVARVLQEQATALVAQSQRADQLLADNAALRQRLAAVEAEQLALQQQRAEQDDRLQQVSARLDALFPQPQLVQTSGAGERQ